MLASTVLAQPKHLAAHRALHEKRGLQYITKVDYFTETVVEYTTLTLAQGETAPSTSSVADAAAAATTPVESSDVQGAGGAQFYPTASPIESSSDESSASASVAPVVPSHVKEAAVYQPSTTLVTTTPPAAVPTSDTPSSVYSEAPASSVASSASSESSSSSSDSSSSSGSLLSYGFSSPSGAGGSRVTDCTSESCTGWGTYYDVSDSMSCGYSPVDASQYVVALPIDWMHNPGNSGTNAPIDPNCGRVVEITSTDTQKTIQAIVVDSCQACIVGTGHIDLSRGAYDALGVSESVGTPAISWCFKS